MQELDAFQDWSFGPREAVGIRQPVLSVVGNARPNPYMQEVRSLLHAWFPQTEDLNVNATHLLQMQDPSGMAQGLAEFFSRHPLK